MVNVIIGVIQQTVTPLLTALVLALLGMLFAWLGRKYHLDVKQADQDYLQGLAVRGIAYAEEEGEEFLKVHGTRLPSESKLADAVSFLLRAAPRLDQLQARDLVTGMLGKTKGAGATGDKTVG